MTWRVTYNALTRQWRVGVGELSLPVDSLEEAMDMVCRIRNWRVADVAELDSGVVYGGQLRLRLNTALLPRPFQVTALNGGAWSLATPWSFFTFSVARPIQDPA